MSITHRDYEENSRRPNGKWSRKPTFAAEYLAQTRGDSPEESGASSIITLISAAN